MLDVYATAIYNKGAALENCFGFIDGTVRPISRHIINQRAVYNGHKRAHALKFQSVALPNGLIGHLYGAVGKQKFMLLLFFPVLKRFDSYFSTILFLYSEGRMHDARMFALSNLIINNNKTLINTPKEKVFQYLQYLFTNINANYI